MQPIQLFDLANPEENIEAQDALCFAHLTEQKLWEAKLSQVLPLLLDIAKDWKLDLKTKRGFDIACRILTNAAKWN